MLKILVIDDLEINLKVAQKMVEGLGYEAFTALSGEIALGMDHLSEIDIFLIDIQMPGMDGFELRRRLKARPDIKGKFIAFTSWFQQKDSHKFHEKGFHEFRSKPCSKLDLKKVICASICASTCINCEKIIRAGIGHYNAPEGPLCTPCGDVNIFMINSAKKERESKKFQKFLQSDENITLFVKDD